MPTTRVLTGDCRERLAELPERSIHCCVTSPPYWGLRDYGVAGQLGLESVPDCLGWATGAPCGACYVCHLVEVFRAVRRVLRDDGTVWLNLGDSYVSSPAGNKPGNVSTSSLTNPKRQDRLHGGKRDTAASGLKPKDLVGIPWRVALALQADGWTLRSEIVWAKKSCMPESVRDRPTRSHEQVFLLAKGPRYYYDAEAVREESTPGMVRRAEAGHTRGANGKLDGSRQDHDTLRGDHAKAIDATGRNLRSVWTNGQPKVTLRADLTDEQRAYVLERLAAHARRGLA